MAEALTPRADPPWRRSIALAIVAGLLAFFAVALLSSMARDSSTWDEGNHIYAGLHMWRRADFGLNPEHPPLVKLLATAPLLGTDLRVAEPRDLEFVKAAFLGGRTLLMRTTPTPSCGERGWRPACSRCSWPSSCSRPAPRCWAPARGSRPSACWCSSPTCSRTARGWRATSASRSSSSPRSTPSIAI